MQMPHFITKFRRDRWRDQVIEVGKKLRSYEASRRSVDARYWPEDAAYLDAEIDRLTRKRDSLLAKIKETA